jgi:carbonic anhydrase/acetyltransferase-like protein (isoleucine patch superfamily)
MSNLTRLMHRIINRININLRKPGFDSTRYILETIPIEQFSRFYAFYGLSLKHPLRIYFYNSSLAGSYFLGKCSVEHSILYKTDVRGDELKIKGESFHVDRVDIPLHKDEEIKIRDSFLIKTLIHNFSHDPEKPEEFWIKNTLSMHYSNIHGAPVEGSFIAPFATIDLTTVHDCIIGNYAYVQVGELAHHWVEPGLVWVRSEGNFDFRYRFHLEKLKNYIQLTPGKRPEGILMDFVETRKKDFEDIFEQVQATSLPSAKGASVSPYAVLKGDVQIGENVFVAQRAYLENAFLGKGSNAQENCYIINSTLKGNNITAHGGKVIHTSLGCDVFIGFNSFVNGKPDAPITIGEKSIVMPHCIIDAQEPINIPPNHLIWGLIHTQADLKNHTISLDELAKVDGKIEKGAMIFQGSGQAFVEGFRHRLEHILEANGAFYDGEKGEGHAQKGQNIVFNIIQPYSDGPLKGLFPTLDIKHLKL